MKISDDQTRLYLELYFKAKEPDRDSTEASGTDTFIIFDTKDTNKKNQEEITREQWTAVNLYMGMTKDST